MRCHQWKLRITHHCSLISVLQYQIIPHTQTHSVFHYFILADESNHKLPTCMVNNSSNNAVKVSVLHALTQWSWYQLDSAQLWCQASQDVISTKSICSFSDMCLCKWVDSCTSRAPRQRRSSVLCKHEASLYIHQWGQRLSCTRSFINTSAQSWR